MCTLAQPGEYEIRLNYRVRRRCGFGQITFTTCFRATIIGRMLRDRCPVLSVCL